MTRGAGDARSPRGSLRREARYLPLDMDRLPFGGDIPFDLYLRTADRYVLYHRAGATALTGADVNALRERGVGHLYLDSSARGDAASFLEARVAERLRDERLSPAERASGLVELSRLVMDELIASPEAPDGLRRVRQLVGLTVDFIATSRAAFHGIVGLFDHDYYTYTHNLHVGVYAVALGQQLGLSRAFLRKVGEGALYHDVGKALVPRELLTRAGPLDADEWEVMKQHPRLGADLLRAHGPCDAVTLGAILGHHERIDGTGYPHGLSGSAVSLPARIVALADIYDALTTHRAYHRARRSYDALDLMRDEMMAGLDADLFRELVLLLARTEDAW